MELSERKKNDNTYNHLYLLSFFIFLLLIVNISSPFAFTLFFFILFWGYCSLCYDLNVVNITSSRPQG